MENIIPQHIEKRPDVCGGSACIRGHRIRVMDIVVWHEMRGYSVDEIVSMFPGVTLADIHAALAYYFDFREELDADLRRDEMAAIVSLAPLSALREAKAMNKRKSKRGDYELE